MTKTCAWAADWLDRWVWDGLVRLTVGLVTALSWISRLIDEFVINLGFDGGCGSLREGGSWLARFQNGQVHRYLRVIGVGLAVLALWLLGS
jgi:hypothetical protein